jgi:hypothetical protein
MVWCGGWWVLLRRESEMERVVVLETSTWQLFGGKHDVDTWHRFGGKYKLQLISYHAYDLIVIEDC